MARRPIPTLVQRMPALVVLVVSSLASLHVVAERSPAKCEDAVEFFVVSHGWHAGLVVPATDVLEALPDLEMLLRNRSFVEVGWGDEQFYRANEIYAELALRALIWPTESVLQVVVFDTHPESYFWASEIVKLNIPIEGYKDLLRFVVNSFVTTDGRLGPALGPSLYGTGSFFRARRSFHAFYTCNTWVADAIDRSGFPWPAERTLTAGALMARLERAILDSSICYDIKF